MKVALILGSIREGRKTVHVAKYIHQLMMAQAGIESELIDLRTYDIPLFESRWEKAEHPAGDLAKMSEKLKEADAMIFISPEYHGSYTGVLKNAIDHYWKEFQQKPIGVVSTGAGPLGGINATIQMQQLVLSLGAFAMPQKLIVPFVQHSFEEDGSPKEDKFIVSAEKFVGEFMWFAKAIHHAKQKVVS